MNTIADRITADTLLSLTVEEIVSLAVERDEVDLGISDSEVALPSIPVHPSYVVYEKEAEMCHKRLYYLSHLLELEMKNIKGSKFIVKYQNDRYDQCEKLRERLSEKLKDIVWNDHGISRPKDSHMVTVCTGWKLIVSKLTPT